MRLSKNFKLEEFLRTSHNVELKPTTGQIKNMQILCQTILQPTRELFGIPIEITSGFRSPELNKIIGGKTHLQGEAADWKFSGVSARVNGLMLWDAYCWIYWSRIFGQLIVYIDTEESGVIYRFIHVSLGDKKEALANFNGKLYNIEKLLTY
jgi:hypothetical protein